MRYNMQHSTNLILCESEPTSGKFKSSTSAVVEGMTEEVPGIRNELTALVLINVHFVKLSLKY